MTEKNLNNKIPIITFNDLVSVIDKHDNFLPCISCMYYKPDEKHWCIITDEKHYCIIAKTPEKTFCSYFFQEPFL